MHLGNQETLVTAEALSGDPPPPPPGKSSLTGGPVLGTLTILGGTHSCLHTLRKINTLQLALIRKKNHSFVFHAFTQPQAGLEGTLARGHRGEGLA